MATVLVSAVTFKFSFGFFEGVGSAIIPFCIQMILLFQSVISKMQSRVQVKQLERIDYTTNQKSDHLSGSLFL